MNILTDALPTSVRINGKEYPINTGFRSCLRTNLAFEDPELTGQEKEMVMLKNIYPVLPDDIGAAIIQAHNFMNGGKTTEGDDISPMRVFSLEHDAGYIFSAFMQTHKLDLETAELHWWKFLALFMDLGSETTFCSLVALRKRVKSGQATKEELAVAREMGDVFNLPELADARSLEAITMEDEFMRQIGKGQKTNVSI